MAEQIRWDLLVDDHGGGRKLRDLGDSADLAAAGAKVLKEALEKQSRAAGASVDASISLARADKLLADAEFELSGKAALADEAMRREADAKQKSARAGAGLAASLGPLSSGMGALVTTGVALSPVIATVGAGLGGLGIAAAGMIGPVA